MTWLVPLVVWSAVTPETPVSYRHEVAGVLARAGCNSGACHGNLNGKGGFRLSLRGEDPGRDHYAITREALGRRVDLADPESSLLLQKGAGRVPHEGGVRFAASSPEYRTLLRWLAAGATDDRDAPALKELAVTPSRAVVPPDADAVAIRARATYADGSARDVTGLLALELSQIGVAEFDAQAVVRRTKPGQTVLLVRYLNRTVPVSLAFLPDRPAGDLSDFPQSHPIDRLAAARWQELRLTPAGRATDSSFLRRATLDATGRLPTADEARAFLTDTRPDKRARLVDDLLGRPAYTDHWARKWADVLRVEEKSLDKKGVQVFHRWLKSHVAADTPLTAVAREILTGRGSTYENPPANFYRALREPYGRSEAVAQVFLGLRIGCARCHNHPFDVWTQADYHEFSALFARIGYREVTNTRRDGLDTHEFVGEQVVYRTPEGELDSPRGGVARPRLLGHAGPVTPGADRLVALADWVADPANPHFAEAQANRVWLHLLGQGLVDPGDDFRASNPASNPELLAELARQFRADGFRLKPLVRLIMTSETYARGLGGTERESGEFHHFAEAVPQLLEAEPLLDAISQVLEVPAALPGVPAGTRAGEVAALPQLGRGGSSTPGTRFLRLFGTPERLLTCECERTDDPGVMQSFQLLTGDVVQAALAKPDNRIGRLLAANTPPDAMLDELYLAALARYPASHERAALLKAVAAGDGRRVWEDIAWGLLNSREFQVRH